MNYSAPLQATIDRARSHGYGDLLWRSACRVPDKTALVWGELRQTYAELDETVNRTANALAERGIAKGERVALLSRNNHAFVVLSFAAARLGAILVPINFMLKAAEVGYILGHSGSVALVAEDTLQPVAAEALALAQAAGASGPVRLRAVIPGHGVPAPAGWESVFDWMRHDDARRPEVDVGDDEPLQLLYTSGTESRPKGAALSSRNLVAQYVSCIVDGEMSGDDIEVHALPLFHCAQLHCFLSPGLYLGATNVLLPGADPAAMLAAVEAERATKLFCPPTVWIALLRHPDFERRDLSSLRKGYYGASIMPMEIVRELSERLPAMRLFNFYGQTEMSPVATVLGPEDQLRKLGSAGRPAINVETRIVDDEDRPVPPGTVGEIVHRGPHVMLGYWNDEQKTAEAFRGGWFHSGDLGIIDEEGYLRVVDRKKDMIKTGGENVASREVEEVLYQHPAVAEAAVFGTPHPEWIEAVTAAIVLREGAQAGEDELKAHCRQRLAGFKTPKRVVFVDALPKNASGKILKRELRERIGQEAAAGN
ncbi:acyl-CoA synthetase [Burkholderiaceae bacterium FT117]|uniref:acyl-CoA synthetase n=1 Tax=Zeimonas sediminis TaxID=2944268 RepID=UPI00234321C5|nr:acyl-CoA synthetase [Zeimonas sediminis]MCM5569583.1 acyl-CoA synthetase [Zeimonas sediminis]